MQLFMIHVACRDSKLAASLGSFFVRPLQQPQERKRISNSKSTSHSWREGRRLPLLRRLNS